MSTMNYKTLPNQLQRYRFSHIMFTQQASYIFSSSNITKTKSKMFVYCVNLRQIFITLRQLINILRQFWQPQVNKYKSIKWNIIIFNKSHLLHYYDSLHNILLTNTIFFIQVLYLCVLSVEFIPIGVEPQVRQVSRCFKITKNQ